LDDVPPLSAPASGEFPLLTPEQEWHLFRKMNFLYHQASKLQQAIEPSKTDPAYLDRFLAVWKEAEELKALIIQSNVRLVFALVKKLARPGQDYFDLVSDANLALIRATERFDFSRGHRFSTYVGWAVMNAFSRVSNKERFRRERLLNGQGGSLNHLADRRPDPCHREHDLEQKAKLIQQMLARLGERERKILASRFGLNGETSMTLLELAKELGISKERVRQIESRAKEKLRTITSRTLLDQVDL
jgi:RNA polymerase primary sigma factor